MRRRIRHPALVASLVLAWTGMALAQPEVQSGWYGTIVSEFFTEHEGEGKVPLSAAALEVLSMSGRHHSFRRTRTTYTLSGEETKAAYEVRTLDESSSVLRGRMACTLEEVLRPRVIVASGHSLATERGQAHGSGECTFETFRAGGVNIQCISAAKGDSQSNVSASSTCSNCCDSPRGKRTEKSPPATSSSSEIDVPSVHVEARFPPPDMPDSLVGSTNWESSDDKKTHGTVSWVLAHKVEFDLEVTLAGYDTWRPKGGESELTRGSSLRIDATLKRKDGKKLYELARKFVFTLVRRSSEPGVMMNWPPWEATKPDEPDLRFDEDLNKPFKLKIGGNRGSEATTPDGSYETASAYVSAYDWGAYGVLTVEAVLFNGRRVLGHLVNNPDQSEILIPKRSGPDDPIAEIWRRQHDVMGIDARDDSDAIPAGDGHAGDGLTLYEEYRGFRVNGTHLSTDPKKKDLFVLNEIGTRVIEHGILWFGQQSGLALHFMRHGEIDKWGINRNSSGTYQNQPQHGVIVQNAAQGHTQDSEGSPPSLAGELVSAKIARGLFASEGWKGSIHNVAHELGHTCWLQHHGESDIGPVRWEWRYQAFLEFQRDLQSNATTGEGTNIVLVLPDGSPLTVARDAGPEDRFFVGTPHGQHSGVEDCLMRYHSADSVQAYSNNKARYRIGDEKVGLRFCSSTKGTGVNAAGGTFDQPRYGDAAPERGNCIAHLCVNDSRIADHFENFWGGR